DINLPALGETWSCTRPLHLRTELFRLPPEDVGYENPFVDPVELVDNATGQPRGEIVYHLHHVDPPLPPPGPDCFDTFLDLQANIPPFGVLFLQAQGPTTVDRGPPQVSGSCDISGTSCQSDADCPLGEICLYGTKQVQTEMLSMDLSGFDPAIGGFQVRLNPAGSPSIGQVVSQNPGTSTFTVDSFFDVFFEIDLVDQGQVLHNEQPLPVQAGPNGPSVGVRNIPPDPQTPFEMQGGPVPLLSEDGGVVGDVNALNHIIDIPKDWLPPPPNEDYCFDSWVHLEVTMFNPFCQDVVWLHGNFRIIRDDPIDSTGDTVLDLMNTLMAKGLFRGDSDCLGALSAALKRDATSAGSISRLTPEEFFPADSFFDVFVQIDSGVGLLHTQDPSFMTTTINALPPDDGEIYYGPGTIIPLYQGLCGGGDPCLADADCPAGQTCSIQQVGEILELEHRVHRQIECPADCNWFLKFAPAFAGDKSTMNLQGPGTGLGLVYDVVRGTLGVLKTNPRPNWSDAVRIGTNVGPTFADNTVPAPGQGFYYVARDGFGLFNGTYNSGGLGQQGNRDPFLP
ncbi:MAG: hypothetical protein R3344_09625, partial [Acidobacteriota bacterium]|nr:hypothetical protein [Acidobacteriota bacterium]